MRASPARRLGPAARAPATALAALLTALLLPPPALAGSGLRNQPYACGDSTLAELDRMGIRQSEVDRIALIQDINTTGSSTEIIVGVTAWVRFPDKKGTLAIVMDRGCNVKTRFTLGEVQVEGVPHH